VEPGIILKWCELLTRIKKEGKLSKDYGLQVLIIFASWGGGGEEYHVEIWTKLIHAVTYFLCIPTPCMIPLSNLILAKFRRPGRKRRIRKNRCGAMVMSKGGMLSYISECTAIHEKSWCLDKPISYWRNWLGKCLNSSYGSDGSKLAMSNKEAGFITSTCANWTKEGRIVLFLFRRL